MFLVIAGRKGDRRSEIGSRRSEISRENEVTIPAEPGQVIKIKHKVPEMSANTIGDEQMVKDRKS